MVWIYLLIFASSPYLLLRNALFDNCNYCNRHLFSYTNRTHTICLIRTCTTLLLHVSPYLTTSSGRTYVFLAETICCCIAMCMAQWLCHTHRKDTTFLFYNSKTNICCVLFCVLQISPITGPRRPEGSRKLRSPDYVTMVRDGGKVVSLTHRPLLPPGNIPGTHFC